MLSFYIMNQRLKSILKLILYFSPAIIFILYSLNKTYRPFGGTEHYTIRAQNNFIQISSNIKMLTEDALNLTSPQRLAVQNQLFFILGNVPVINDQTKLQYILTPERPQQVEYTTFRTDRFDKPHQSEFLTWYPLTFPGYAPIAQTEDFMVLGQLNADGRIESIDGSVEEWILANLPAGSRIGTTPPLSLDMSLLSAPVQVRPPARDTHLPWTIRGSLELYVYAFAPEITIQFTKQDINRYFGEDTYEIIVSDLAGREYFYGVVEDDGIVDESYQEYPQREQLTIPISQTGTYHIQLRSNLATEARQIETDSTISDITLNTPYVVTNTNEIRFLEPMNILASRNAYIQFLNADIKRYRIRTLQEPASFTARIADGQQQTVAIIESSLADDPRLAKLETFSGTFVKGAWFAAQPEQYFEPYQYMITSVSPDYWIVPREKAVPNTVAAPNRRQDRLGIGLRAVDRNGNVTPLHRVQEIQFILTRESIFARSEE